MNTQEYRSRQHNGYLDDHAEIKAVIHDWLEGLELDRYGVAYDKPRLEEIECRSRDGFIAHSHNRGGFDLEYLSQVSSCVGSGCGPDLAAIDKSADWAYGAALEWFKETKADEIQGLPDDKLNYHDLCELGRSDLAEWLAESEYEHMNTPVWWGVRAMYEGQDENGIHTLSIYASGNVSEYYGFAGKGSETKAQHEIRFRTASGLRRQLERLTKKVERAF